MDAAKDAPPGSKAKAAAKPNLLPFGAEDAARAAVEKILTKGGEKLYGRYIEEKSFTFAAEIATTAAMCQVEMTNPTHDEVDIASDWAIEEDCSALGGDNWIRMKIPKAPPRTEILQERLLEGAAFRPRSAPATALRRKPVVSSKDSDTSSQNSQAGRSGTMSSKASTGDQAQNLQAQTGQPRRPKGYRPPSAPAAGAKAVGVGPLRDYRAYPVRDDFVPDEDEDKLRAAKARFEQDKLRWAEEERQRLLDEEAEQEKEEQRRLADEQDTRPRTYDADGRIIWIREPDPDELPPVQPVVDVDIAARDNDFKETVPNFQTLQKQKPLPKEEPKEVEVKGKRKRGLQKTRKDAAEEKPSFTDSFYKPEYMQPPVINTMQVKPGVILACMGQQKLGAALTHLDRNRQMTRKEYVRMAEQRDRPSSANSSAGGQTENADSSPKAKGGATTAGKRERPSSAPGASRDAKRDAATAAALDVGGTLDLRGNGDATGGKQQSSKEAGGTKVVQQSHNHHRAKPLVFVAGGPEHNSKAPPAPSWSVRNSGRALKGAVRPPRFHVSPLGTCLRMGSAPQPPLGATMGHGLIRNGTTKGAYYFPQGLPSPLAGGPPSPASGRQSPSSRGPSTGRAASKGQSPKSGQRPASALARVGSEPALPRGAAWLVASPGSTQ